MSSSTLNHSNGPTSRPYALEEVQAAVRALQAGEFRDARPAPGPAEPDTHTAQPRTTRRAPADAADWTPLAGSGSLP